MLTNVYREFKLRKENNTTIMDILNLFWLEKTIEKEFFIEEDEDNEFPMYFTHPKDVYYF